MPKIDYTVIYSQPSIEALETLFEQIFQTFNLPYSIDDICYYGVFCKDITYSNFNWNDPTLPSDLEIPEQLNGKCADIYSRLEYVRYTIKRIMMGEIERPEWMSFVEMTECANDYGQAPSTFLYIQEKEEKFKKLCSSLINFLYSPNKLTTMIDL